jgi:hypothetical protein
MLFFLANLSEKRCNPFHFWVSLHNIELNFPRKQSERMIWHFVHKFVVNPYIQLYKTFEKIFSVPSCQKKPQWSTFKTNFPKYYWGILGQIALGTKLLTKTHCNILIYRMHSDWLKRNGYSTLYLKASFWIIGNVRSQGCNHYLLHTKLWSLSSTC